MNIELLRMSNAELAHWMATHAPIEPRHVGNLFSVMELHCAYHPIAITELAERVVKLLSEGVAWTTVRRKIFNGDSLEGL